MQVLRRKINAAEKDGPMDQSTEHGATIKIMFQAFVLQ